MWPFKKKETKQHKPSVKPMNQIDSSMCYCAFCGIKDQCWYYQNMNNLQASIKCLECLREIHIGSAYGVDTNQFLKLVIEATTDDETRNKVMAHLLSGKGK